MLANDELPPLPEFPGASTPVLRAALQSIARDYGRAVEQAAYAAAIKACENTQDYGLIAQVMKRDCADAIRELMGQPK